MWKAPTLVVCSIALLSGCANFSSIHRTLDTTEGKGVLIDVKQRAILASTKTSSETGKAPYTVVCAEPSPDALSAYAFDLAAAGKLSSGRALDIAFGSAESAAYIGLRTQSIQLLRDQFFRACEAYMNQAISSEEYNLLIRRYQKQTAALLAIEQLTGALRVPVSQVSAAGSSQNSALIFLKGEHEDNKNKIAELEKKQKDEAATEEDKKAWKAEQDELKTLNNKLLQDIAKIPGAQITSTVAGSVESPSNQGGSNANGLNNVAWVVRDIVNNITLIDDFMQICIIKFGSSEKNHTKGITQQGESTNLSGAKFVDNIDPPPPYSSLYDACMDRMKAMNDGLNMQNKLIEQYMEAVMKGGHTPEKKMELLSKALAVAAGGAATFVTQSTPNIDGGKVESGTTGSAGERLLHKKNPNPYNEKENADN